MSDTEKRDFTEEIKVAYRNSIAGDSDLMLGLVMEITAGNRGKLFLLRDKQDAPIYSYYISPIPSKYGSIRGSQDADITAELAVSEVKVVKTIIDRIQEHGLANVGVCVVIESLGRESYEYLHSFVQKIYENWPNEFQQEIIRDLKEVLFGKSELETVIKLVKNKMKEDLTGLVQLYKDLHGGYLMTGDLDDYELSNMAKAVIWLIEREHGADF